MLVKGQSSHTTKEPGTPDHKGTIMQSSKLGFQAWTIAFYMAATNIKGISSLKLHREQRIQFLWEAMGVHSGPCEPRSGRVPVRLGLHQQRRWVLVPV